MRRIAPFAACILMLIDLAVPTQAQSQTGKRPLSSQEIIKLAASDVAEARLIDLIKELGISFTPMRTELEKLRKGGVSPSAIEAVKKQVPRGQTPDFYMQAGDELNEEGRADEAAVYYRLGQGLPAEEAGSPGRAKSSTVNSKKGQRANPLASDAAKPQAKEARMMDDDESASVPGVDMSGLNAAQKRRAVARMKSESCTCGCKYTVAECREKDPTCQVSVQLAQQIVREVGESGDPEESTIASSGIFINNRELTASQIAEIKRLYMFVAPPGRYWYDTRSGLWGLMGREAAGFLNPGHDFGTLPANASNGDTGVFINGRELNLAEALYCKQLFGAVYQGHWWLDGRTGNIGVEGNPMPIANVYMILHQRGRSGDGGYSWSSKNTGAYGGSDGNCSYVSIPGSGSVMTGNCD